MSSVTPVRTFSIRKVDYANWWLVGAPRNWKPGDEWLIAHDVYHHVDGDTGSVAEEIMSFGAELWLDYVVHGSHAVNASTLGGVLLEPFEAGAVKAQKLQELLPPCPADELGSLLAESGLAFSELSRLIAKSCAEGAVEELLAGLPQRNIRAGTLAFKEQLSSEETAQRYAQWILLGLLKARIRYPDPSNARSHFGWLQTLVQKMETGEVMRLSMSETGELSPVNRVAKKAMKLSPHPKPSLFVRTQIAKAKHKPQNLFEQLIEADANAPVSACAKCFAQAA